MIPEFISRTIQDHLTELNFFGLASVLIDYTLQHPEQGAVTVAVTGILAKPSLWQGPAAAVTRQKARNFFLLMSLHPSPQVRLHALVGLAAFTQSDPLLVNHLLAESKAIPQRVVDFNNYQPRLIAMLAHLSEQGTFNVYLERWEAQLLAVYQRWSENPFIYQITDEGDYRWERTANAAAGAALLWSAGQPALEREYLITVGDDRQQILVRESLSTTLGERPIYSLLDGWGVALNVVKTMQVPSNSSLAGHRWQKYLFDGRLIKEAKLENLWLMDALSVDQLDELFTRLRAHFGASFYFGDHRSLITWIRYKLLGAHYQHAVILAIDYREPLLANGKDKAINPFNAALEGQGLQGIWQENSGGNKDRHFGHDLALLFPPPTPVEQSIFTAPIETLFAIDALREMGEQDLARETLIKLFPRRWELTWEETALLQARFAQDYRHFFVAAVEMNDAMKLKSIDELVKRLFLLESSVDARRFLIRWIATLPDPLLQGKMQVHDLIWHHLSDTQSCQAAVGQLWTK